MGKEGEGRLRPFLTLGGDLQAWGDYGKGLRERLAAESNAPEASTAR